MNNDKTQDELDEELIRSLLPTIDDMFERIFPRKMFCEVEEDIEDVELSGDDDDNEAA